MYRRSTLILTLLSICFYATLMTNNYPLIIDHDGGVDDVIATTLHLLSAPAEIKAITIAPADCYGLPAAWVMKQLSAYCAPGMHIPLGLSTDEGPNPFPAIWREDAWKVARLPFWQDKEGLRTFSTDGFPSALTILEKALRTSPVPVTILETGPCSNIAELLRVYPALKAKIRRIFIMGGAIAVKGNVEEPEHDGSAEWNIYNNPAAFKAVLQSGIAITLIPLDATQYTPIRKEFMASLAKNSHLKQCKLVHDSLKLIQALIDNGQYLFWDTLTSAAVINPKIIKTERMKINVAITGPSMGRTYKDPHGFEVDVATWADQKLFERTILDILCSNP